MVELGFDKNPKDEPSISKIERVMAIFVSQVQIHRIFKSQNLTVLPGSRTPGLIGISLMSVLEGVKGVFKDSFREYLKEYFMEHFKKPLKRHPKKHIEKYFTKSLKYKFL